MPKSKLMTYDEMMKHISLPPGYKAPKMRGDINGNAWVIVGATCQALRKAGKTNIEQRLKEVVMKGDYNALLSTCSTCVEFVFPSYEGLDDE